MSEGTFERVSDTDRRLYGTRKVVFCGFPAKAQPALEALMAMVDLGAVPKLFLGADHADQTMAALVQLPDGTGGGIDSELPRAVIVGGITEKELQQLMGGARASRMQPPLWAVLTPVSENWTLGALLAELSAEREALARNPAPD